MTRSDFLQFAPHFLIVWVPLAIISEAIVIYDLRKNNYFLGGLMKWVWGLTVLYAGPIGLLVYYTTGRGQIPEDSLQRKAFRSVSHCYSGCGLGEIVGVFIAAGLLSWGNWGVSILTFILAYIIGFGFTIGPLMQGGESFKSALKDSIIAETLSITVMEVVAIAIDLYLAKGTNLGHPIFWFSLIVSLMAGYFAAYPVNWLLIRYGIKEGMHNPQHMMHMAMEGGDHKH